ncbi:hypothetical protein HDU67_006857 [Dinochytrium kinnereticum]|nr:hypothetical protein HDU67_006857 [Dinochytrium kinnereticum]
MGSRLRRSDGNPQPSIAAIPSDPLPTKLPLLSIDRPSVFWKKNDGDGNISRQLLRKPSGQKKMIALPPIASAVPGSLAASSGLRGSASSGKAIQQSQFARAMLALPTMDEAGAGAHSKMRKQQQRERMAANSARPGLLVDSIVSDFLSSENSSVNQLLNFLAGGGEDFVASSTKAAAKKKKKKMRDGVTDPTSTPLDEPVYQHPPEHAKVHKMSFSVARNTFLTAVPDTNENLAESTWRTPLRKVKLMLSVTKAFYELIEIAVNCGRLRYKLIKSRGATSDSPRQTAGKDEEPQTPLLVANLIGFNLENYRARKRHFVGTLSDEMRIALLKSPEEKTDADADILQKLTLNMPAFMKYDHTVRRALAGLQCETELLWVNKDDFIQVLKLEATKDLEDKENFLLSIPFFAGLSSSSIKSLAYNSQMREVQPNVVLFAEGEAAGYVFIMRFREGNGRLIKYVPFEEVYLDKKKSKYLLLPHPLPSNLLPPFGSRKVGRFLRIQEVGPRDFFGEGAALAAMGTAQQHTSMSLVPFSISGSESLEPSSQSFPPRKMKPTAADPADTSYLVTQSRRSRKSTPDEWNATLRAASISPFSLVSTTRVKCLLISRIDFARCCTLELAKVAGERINDEKRALLDMSKIQETYLYNRHWRDVRKKILASSMSEALERQQIGSTFQLFK